MDPDAAVLLADFVSSLENLPLEVHHILQEIGHKEARSSDLKSRAGQRDQSIQKHAKPTAQGGMGLLVQNPKEEIGIGKIRVDLDKAEAVAKDKLALSERGVALVSLLLPSPEHKLIFPSQLARHLLRLSAQLESLTANVPPLPVLPNFTPAAPQPAATPVAYNQVYAPTGTPTLQQQQQAQAQAFQQLGQAGYPAAGTYGMGTGSTTAATPAYGYAPDASPKQNAAYAFAAPTPVVTAGSARAHRPSRLSNVNYPVGTSAPLTAGMQQQIQQQLQQQQLQQQQLANHQSQQTLLAHSQQLNSLTPQQQQALQQSQQMQLQQQQLAQRQALHASQQQQLQSQSQSLAQQQQIASSHHHVQKKRRKNEDDGTDEEGEEEGVDGEDSTPYCFCQRPSFGEVRLPFLTQSLSLLILTF